jgi:hypothetical protein
MMGSGDDYLKGIQDQVESTLLAQEQVYNRLRQTGESARAKIISVMDTGVRIGDTASMLRFAVQVFPDGRPPFRAETQNSIADTSRPKFIPDATVYVKFDPRDLTQVALDHAAMDAPRAQAAKCPACGAVQELKGDSAVCAYCGNPLSG